MAKLIDNTMVVNPETREPALLAAGGELPDWAKGLVGAHLLEEGGEPVAADDEVTTLKARIAELEREKASPTTPSLAPATGGNASKVPPRSGPGSGAPEWRAYAAHLQVEVPAGAGRDEVIAALDAAGKPTK